MANRRFIFEGGNRSIYEETSSGSGKNIFTLALEWGFIIILLLLAYVILAPLVIEFFSGIIELLDSTIVAGVILMAFGMLALLLIYLFFTLVS